MQLSTRASIYIKCVNMDSRSFECSKRCNFCLEEKFKINGSPILFSKKKKKKEKRKKKKEIGTSVKMLL